MILVKSEGVIGENIQHGNAKTYSNGRRNQYTPLDIVYILRSLRVELQSYKVDNEKLVKAHEECNQIKVSCCKVS